MWRKLISTMPLSLLMILGNSLRAEAKPNRAVRTDQLLGCWYQSDPEFNDSWRFCFTPKGKGSYAALEALSLHVSDFTWTYDKARDRFIVRWKNGTCRSASLAFDGATLAGNRCGQVWRLAKEAAEMSGN